MKKKLTKQSEQLESKAKILRDLRRYSQMDYYALRENGASHSLALAIITEKLYEMITAMTNSPLK